VTARLHEERQKEQNYAQELIVQQALAKNQHSVIEQELHLLRDKEAAQMAVFEAQRTQRRDLLQEVNSNLESLQLEFDTKKGQVDVRGSFSQL